MTYKGDKNCAGKLTTKQSDEVVSHSSQSKYVWANIFYVKLIAE